MNRLGIAGALWLVAAGSAIAMTIIFRTDPAQIVVTTAVGVVAAILGVWLMARPNALTVSASNVVTVVWIVLYAVLSALFLRAQGGGWSRVTFGAALAAVAFSTAYGVTDELHQYFVPPRQMDGFDLVADTLGAALAAGALYAGIIRPRHGL